MYEHLQDAQKVTRGIQFAVGKIDGSKTIDFIIKGQLIKDEKSGTYFASNMTKTEINGESRTIGERFAVRDEDGNEFFFNVKASVGDSRRKFVPKQAEELPVTGNLQV